METKPLYKDEIIITKNEKTSESTDFPKIEAGKRYAVNKPDGKLYILNVKEVISQGPRGFKCTGSLVGSDEVQEFCEKFSTEGKSGANFIEIPKLTFNENDDNDLDANGDPKVAIFARKDLSVKSLDEVKKWVNSQKFKQVKSLNEVVLGDLIFIEGLTKDSTVLGTVVSTKPISSQDESKVEVSYDSVLDEGTNKTTIILDSDSIEDVYKMSKGTYNFTTLRPSDTDPSATVRPTVDATLDNVPEKNTNRNEGINMEAESKSKRIDLNNFSIEEIENFSDNLSEVLYPQLFSNAGINMDADLNQNRSQLMELKNFSLADIENLSAVLADALYPVLFSEGAEVEVKTPEKTKADRIAETIVQSLKGKNFGEGSEMDKTIIANEVAKILEEDKKVETPKVAATMGEEAKTEVKAEVKPVAKVEAKKEDDDEDDKVEAKGINMNQIGQIISSSIQAAMTAFSEMSLAKGTGTPAVEAPKMDAKTDLNADAPKVVANEAAKLEKAKSDEAAKLAAEGAKAPVSTEKAEEVNMSLHAGIVTAQIPAPAAGFDYVNFIKQL